ncbi:MAG: exo-alpha-sialidase, partial [Thermoplasmata archaeon]|nr:exo-alpha-sialidase [Thermoplasmata archaeon]
MRERKIGKKVLVFGIVFLMILVVFAGLPMNVGADLVVDWEDNIADDATPSGSGTPYNIYQWNDGILTGQNAFVWCTGTGTDGAYMEYRWDKPVVVAAFTIYQFYTTDTRTLIGCKDMQYWDGSKYVSLGGYHAATLGLYTTGKPYSIELPKVVRTTRFRLYNILGYLGQVSNPSISEWEVYSGGGGGDIPGWGAYGPGCHNVTMSLNFTVPDDYPKMGTIADELNITVWVRDDDHNTFVPGRGIGPLEEPKMVDSGYIYYNNGRKVVVDKDYNIYVIYYKQITTPVSSNQIIVSKSEDNGNTWEQHLVTNQWYFTYTSAYPSLTIDSKGVLHAIWCGGTAISTNYNIRYANSKDGGITWGDHFNLTATTSYYHYYPSIACDKDDKIHIVWYGRENATYYNNVHYINRSADGTWGALQMVTTWLYISPYMYTYHASVETDSKGNVHVVWRGYIETTRLSYNIGYRVLWANNGTWSNIIPLTSDTGYYKYYPCISVDENDDIHVIWYGTDSTETGYNAVYMMYDSSTATWGPREYLTTVTNQYVGTVGFNQKGEVDALWYGYRLPSLTYPQVVHHSQKSTTGWEADYNFIRSAANNLYPNLMSSPPNSIAEEGFAFVYYDGSIKYWASEDFRMGNPEYLNGLDWCNSTVFVKNVEPKINLTAMGEMDYVQEQEEFNLRLFFEDPGMPAITEIFETKIDWGDGNIDDWTVHKAYPVEAILKGRNPETGIAAVPLKGEHSYKDKPITYLKFEYFQPSYSNYWYINLEGYNMTTKAWEQLFYHYAVSRPSGAF